MNIRSNPKVTKIFEATFALVAEHGIHNTPMSAIARGEALSTVVPADLLQALQSARAPLLRGSWHLPPDAWPPRSDAHIAREAAWRLVRDLLAQRS